MRKTVSLSGFAGQEALRAAIDAVLAGKQVSKDQEPAVGCSIKWKKS